MDNNNNKKTIQEEFQASQTYKVLNGNKTTKKIANGINTTASVVDGIVSDIRNSTAGRKNRNTDTVDTNQYQQDNKGSGYNYTYNYSYKSTPKNNQNPNVQYRTQKPYTADPNTYNAQRPYYNPNYDKNRKKGRNQYKTYKPNRVPTYDSSKYMAVREPSTAKYYLTGAVSLFYALSAPMYRPLHYLIFLLVTVGAFALFSLICRGKVRIVPIEQPKPVEKKEEEPKETGNSEVDKIIKTGHDYIKKLRAADEAIPNEDVSECIERMAVASEGIFDYIAKNPDKASQIRKFMNYYLPTTMKLLESYQRLDGQSVKGENVQTTLNDISRIMYTIANAFENQLDSLFSDEAMDISADISVFETMLKQEGFVTEDINQKKENKE